MKNRIKKIRSEVKLSQTDFGKKLGVSLSAVQKWESGENVPTSAIIYLICREFGVDELWLREGVGEMFRSRSRSDDIAAFMGDILKAGDGDFRTQMVHILSRLEPDDWELLKRMAKSLAKETSEEEHR